MTVDIPEGYMKDAKGRLVPESMVPPGALIEDQTVRTIVQHGRELSAQIARFKGHTFDDINECLAILSEKCGATKGGAKGNLALSTFDGCEQVKVQVQDMLTFGPELQIAKQKIDEVLSSWTHDADPKIKAIVDHAFAVDKAGQINREALFSLRRLVIEDEGWKQAMQALTDSIRMIGSRQYVRIYERDDASDKWRAISIDIATVDAPPAAAA